MALKDHAKSIVYGGLDGIVTTFAVIAGSIGGGLGTATIIILGFSNLLGDGFSMAAGDYLSSTTEEGVDTKEAISNAVTTFLSFNFFGLIPLFAYLGIVKIDAIQDYAFFLASIIVSIALLILGYVKGLITEQAKAKEMTRTLIVGLFAAGVAYFIGELLGQLILG